MSTARHLLFSILANANAGIAAGIGILICLAVAPAQAQTNWTGLGVAGQWSDPDNWSAGVPDGSITVQINPTGVLEIDLDDSTDAGTVRLFRGTEVVTPGAPPTVVFNLQGNDFSLNDDTLLLVATSSATRTLVFDGNNQANSTVSLDGTTYFGHRNDGTVEVLLRKQAIMDGRDVYLGWEGGSRVINMYIDSTSEFNVPRRLGIGQGAGNVGLIELDGGSLTVGNDSNGFMNIGNSGSGIVRITEGGTVSSTSNSVNMAVNAASEGTLEVTGSNGSQASRFTAGNLYISGNNSGGGGNALAYFADGGEGVIDNLLVRRTLHEPAEDDPFTTVGVLHIDGGLVTVNNTATFQSDSILRFTLNDPTQAIGLSANVLDINGALLELVIGDSFSAGLGETILLAEYDSLIGTFFDKAEGSEFSVAGFDYAFEISYVMGDGSTIGLTVVPEPRVYAALFGLLALAVAASRRVSLARKR